MFWNATDFNFSPNLEGHPKSGTSFAVLWDGFLFGKWLLTCFCAKRVCWVTFYLERVYETEGLAFYQLEMADGVFRCFVQVLISQVGWLSTWPAVRAWSCQGLWPSKWGEGFIPTHAVSGRLRPTPIASPSGPIVGACRRPSCTKTLNRGPSGRMGPPPSSWSGMDRTVVRYCPRCTRWALRGPARGAEAVPSPLLRPQCWRSLWKRRRRRSVVFPFHALRRDKEWGFYVVIPPPGYAWLAVREVDGKEGPRTTDRIRTPLHSLHPSLILVPTRELGPGQGMGTGYLHCVIRSKKCSLNPSMTWQVTIAFNLAPSSKMLEMFCAKFHSVLWLTEDLIRRFQLFWLVIEGENPFSR